LVSASVKNWFFSFFFSKSNGDFVNKRNLQNVLERSDKSSRKLRALSRESNGASSARSAAHSLMHYNTIVFAVAGDYWHKERER
jgi:hypothetical protein